MSLRILLLLALLLLQSGCASLFTTMTKTPSYRRAGSIGYRGPRVYSGVRVDAKGVVSEAFIIAIIDLPLSFVFDTLFLPYTIPKSYQDDDDREAFIDSCVERLQSKDPKERRYAVWDLTMFPRRIERVMPHLQKIAWQDSDDEARMQANELLSRWKQAGPPD